MECRICLSDGILKGKNSLVSPCKCNGSMKYVHEDCFEESRKYPGKDRACDVCKTVYNIFTPFLEYEDIPEIMTYIPSPEHTLAIILGFIATNFFFRDPKYANKDPVNLLALGTFIIAHYIHFGYYLLGYIRLLRTVKNPRLYSKIARGHITLPIIHGILLYYLRDNTLIFALPLVLSAPAYFTIHLTILKDINTHIYEGDKN